MKKKYCVVVIEKATDLIVKELVSVQSLKVATQVVKGADINLNHDKFRLEIRDLICPKCKENEIHADEVMNSLSRKDNKTYICNSCGVQESMEEMGLA